MSQRKRHLRYKNGPSSCIRWILIKGKWFVSKKAANIGETEEHEKGRREERVAVASSLPFILPKPSIPPKSHHHRLPDIHWWVGWLVGGSFIRLGQELLCWRDCAAHLMKLILICYIFRLNPKWFIYAEIFGPDSTVAPCVVMLLVCVPKGFVGHWTVFFRLFKQRNWLWGAIKEYYKGIFELWGCAARPRIGSA